MTESLGTAFPKEQARCREVLGHYQSIGPAGMFGAAQIEEVLKRADQASADGDCLKMLQIYKEMKKIES